MEIRLEKSEESFATEELVRESFWNVYRPGCAEHFILHNYRSNPGFVKELNYVGIEDGYVVAQIMYAKAQIECDNGDVIDALTFGPVSVHPQYQNRGLGAQIINFTLSKAKEMGYGGVLICGNEAYYKRFGFVRASQFGISYSGMPKDAEAPFFLAKELVDGYFDKSGTYADPDGYAFDEQELEQFDLRFPPKPKEAKPGQLGFEA